MNQHEEAKLEAVARYQAARAALDSGNHPEALSLLEKALRLFNHAEDAVGYATTLWGIAEIHRSDGEYERALEVGVRLLPALDAIGDVRARSLTLDKMAVDSAELDRWPQAIELWRQALDLDCRFGSPRDQAVTLTNMGNATEKLGDVAGALALWSQALHIFEGSADVEGQIPLLSCMAQASFEQGDAQQALQYWQRAYLLADSCGDLQAPVLRGNAARCLDELGELSSSVELHLQSLAALEGPNDGPTRAQLLGGAARVLARSGDAERAFALWSEALQLQQRLGDAEGEAQTLRMLAQPSTSHRTMFSRTVPARSSATLLRQEPSFSLSEYTLAPSSAPLFRVGELLAAIHAAGARFEQLRPGRLQLMMDGTVAVASGLSFRSQQALDPDRMAADFRVPFATYPWEDFRAILAGYARSGYERIDHLQSGFTDSVLDALGVPAERPRPRPAALDIPRVLASLGIQIAVTGPAPLTLGLEWASHRPWQARLESSVDGCLLLLCCLLLDVECEPLIYDVHQCFGTNLGPTFAHFFALVRGQAAPNAALLAQLPPGLDLALHIALKVRGTFAPGEPCFAKVMLQLCDVLRSPAQGQASKLGDALVDVALYCSGLTDEQSATVTESVSYAQKAVMLLQWQATGLAQDEARLAAVTRGLCGRKWYPAPNAQARWPATKVEIALSNSLLLAYKAFVRSALSLPEGQAPGMLWSAAYRGIELARSTVRQVHALVGASSPEDAMDSLRVLPTIVRSYAWLLDGLLLGATQEHERAGRSGWLEFFVERDGEPSHLELERRWIGDFLTALESDFSLETVDEHVRQGALFIARRGPSYASN